MISALTKFKPASIRPAASTHNKQHPCHMKMGSPLQNFPENTPGSCQPRLGQLLPSPVLRCHLGMCPMLILFQSVNQALSWDEEAGLTQLNWGRETQGSSKASGDGPHGWETLQRRQGDRMSWTTGTEAPRPQFMLQYSFRLLWQTQFQNDIIKNFKTDLKVLRLSVDSLWMWHLRWLC
jgi:hypothetical protein